MARYYIAADEHGYTNSGHFGNIPENIGKPQSLPAVENPKVGDQNLMHAYPNPSEAIWESNEAWPLRLFVLEGTPVASDDYSHVFTDFTFVEELDPLIVFGKIAQKSDQVLMQVREATEEQTQDLLGRLKAAHGIEEEWLLAHHLHDFRDNNDSCGIESNHPLWWPMTDWLEVETAAENLSPVLEAQARLVLMVIMSDGELPESLRESIMSPWEAAFGVTR